MELKCCSMLTILTPNTERFDYYCVQKIFNSRYSDEKLAGEKSQTERDVFSPFSNSITAHFAINSLPLYFLAEINPTQLKDGGERRKKKDRAPKPQPAHFIWLRGEQTERLASLRWKQLLVFRLHSPLLVSPSAHTSTPWSPLATRNKLYMLQPTC